MDQIDSQHCYDCMVLNRTRSEKDKSRKTAAWASVRPATADHPKRTEPGHRDEDLPDLGAGDKAVIAPILPVVTIQKNHYANKKLRQESISLLQDAERTWSNVLPRTDLQNRFVLIERVTKDEKIRHMVANAESVRQWLMFLFDNHQEFIRMKKEGQLEQCANALEALKSHSELAEVHRDVEASDSEEGGDGKQQEENVNQAELHSGFSKTDVFTFDKYPHLYLKPSDVLKIKQSGKMQLIQDRQVRVPTYNASSNLAFPYLFPMGEKSPIDLGDFKLARYTLKKLCQFAHRMADGTYKWRFASDDVWSMYSYARYYY